MTDAEAILCSLDLLAAAGATIEGDSGMANAVLRDTVGEVMRGGPQAMAKVLAMMSTIAATMLRDVADLRGVSTADVRALLDDLLRG